MDIRSHFITLRHKTTLKLHRLASWNKHYAKWHENKWHKHVHVGILAVYLLSIVGVAIGLIPNQSYAAWNNTATWTTKAEFENGTTLTDVSVTGDNDANDANNNDNFYLSSQAERKQTVAAGSGATMVAKADGTVWATGHNNYYQLGTGNTAPQKTWVQSNITDVVSVNSSTSSYNFFSIKSDGTLWGVGWNGYGSLGMGTTGWQSNWIQLKKDADNYLTDVKKVTGAYVHSAALTSDGKAWVTGRDNSGQLGNGADTDKYYWTDTGLGTDNVDVGVTDTDTYVLKSDGNIYVAGGNAYGQLGLGTEDTPITTWTQSVLPTLQQGEKPVSLAIGTTHALFLTNLGNIYGAGSNGGRLGTGDSAQKNDWTLSVGISSATSVYAGYSSSFAIDASGNTYGTGGNNWGELNVGDMNNRASFTLTNYTDASYIAMGAYTVLVVKKDGSLIAAGNNYYGSLGFGDHFFRNTPTQTNFSGASSVITGGSYAAAAVKNGNVWGVGMGEYHRNGFTDGVNRNLWTQTSFGGGAATKAEGCNNCLIVLKNDGTVWGIGYNAWGQLGVGDFATTKAVYTQAKTGAATYLTGIEDISIGAYHGLALTSTGDVYVTGYNNNGQLGLGGAIPGTNKEYWTLSYSGATVPAIAVSAGDYFSMILLQDGTVKTVGYNASGQLGIDSTASQSTWQDSRDGANPITGVSVISAGAANGYAIKSGELFVIGESSDGALGLGATGDKDLWTATGITGVNFVAGGYATGFYGTSGGDFYAAGANYYGQLGLGNNTSNITTWTLVPVSGITTISPGYIFTIFIKEGSVYSAGWDTYGQLGMGFPWIRSVSQTLTGVRQPSPYLLTGSIKSIKLNAGATVKWEELIWDANVPAGTLMKARSRGAATEEGLAAAIWSDYYLTSGENISTANSQWLELEIYLESTDGTYSPIVSSFSVIYYTDILAPPNPTDVTAWTAPDKQVSIPGGDTWGNSKNIYFDWTEPVDNGESGTKGYWVYFGKDHTVDPRTGGSFQSASEFTTVIDDADSGEEFFLCISTEDYAGNRYTNAVEPFYQVFNYKFDNTSPINPAYINKNPVGWTATNSFDFNWPNGSDPGQGKSDIQGYQYKRGGGGDDWSTIQNINEVLAITAYQEGQNDFLLRTVDWAGNISTQEMVVHYYWSGSSPSVPQNIQVNPNNSVENAFTFTWEEPAAHNAPIAGYYYSINETPRIDNSVYTEDLTTGLIAAATIQGTNTFYVVAIDDTGKINWDAANDFGVEFECNTPAPAAPGGVVISDSSNRETQNWAITTAWNSVAGTGIHYHIYRSTDGVNFSKHSESNSTGYYDNGLSTTSTYHYYIKAADSANKESAPSTTVSKQPTGKYTEPPITTSGPEVRATATSAVVTWSTDRPSSSFVAYSKNEGYGESKGQLDSATSHRVLLTGLEPGTKYNFKTQSFDENRDYATNEAFSIAYNFTTQSAPGISEVSTTDIGLYSATISWKTTTVATSKVLYGPNTAYGNTIEDGSGSQVTTHTVKLTDLSHSTDYHFKIMGTDTDGNQLVSDDYTFKTLIYPRVSNIRFESQKNTATSTLKVTWLSNVPLSSVVEYAEENGTGREVSASSLTLDHSILVPGLKDNTNYLITVRGRDAYGNPAQSDVNLVRTDYDTRPPAISAVATETSTQGMGLEARGQIVVSWETDEPSTSQVEYSSGSTGDFSSKTQEDTSLTTTHVVIISDLKTSSPYHFRVISKDVAGNASYSDSNSILTNQASESVIDVIIKSLQATIGWVFTAFRR